MKIRYISDIHLEHIPPQNLDKFIQKIIPQKPDDKNTVCVLAGDIGILQNDNDNYDQFMKFISKTFEKTFVIAGNHEYYHQTTIMEETNAKLTQYFQQYNNIRFLDNAFEIYRDVCFIGTTLWTHINQPLWSISDINRIPRFTVEKYNQLHRNNVEFLENVLQNNTRCVVITHHIPSNCLLHDKFKTPFYLPYNQWFVCDLNPLIEKNQEQIMCWIYGHTHMASEMSLFGIPFLCNPVGYPDENSGASFDKQITLTE